MILIIVVWTAVVSSLTTVTIVRDNCIKAQECKIIPEKIGISISKE